MGVELGVAGPRRAVPEPGGDEALDGDVVVAVPAPPGEQGVGLQIGDAVGDGPVVGVGHCGPNQRVGV
jgi:hypothetical protein